MARLLLVTLLFLSACARTAPPADTQSFCSEQSFDGSRFTTCAAPNGSIELHSSGADGRPLRSFAALQSALGNRSDRVAFAMNGGMFDEQARPIGLLVERGRQLHKINRREGGGNFHLLPNGVFLVRGDGAAAIVPSQKYEASDIRFATQSGPMLVIDGKLHPKFDADGESRNIRNGVGIAPDGTAWFVISEDPVSFGKFARFFRDRLKARDALYFDGAVSSLWDPANGRRDAHSELGPMVVVFKPAASTPGRAGRATP